MHPLGYMFLPLKKYADFEGRSTRIEYWMWSLFNILLLFVFHILVAISVSQSVKFYIFLAQGLIWLGLLIPSLAVGVRRFHDTGRTGWWILVPMAALFIATIAFFVHTGQDIKTLFSLFKRTEAWGRDAYLIKYLYYIIGQALLIIYLPCLLISMVTLYFKLSVSEPRSNRFGENPLPKVRATQEAFMAAHKKFPLLWQPLIKYSDFYGRARRSEFWQWVLAQVFIYVIFLVSLVCLIIANSKGSQAIHMLESVTVLALGFDVFVYLTMAPNYSLSVRRLHDINRSGWWLLMPQFIGLLAFAFFIYQAWSPIRFIVDSHFNPAQLATQPHIILSIWHDLCLYYLLPCLVAKLILLVMLCLDGTPKSNSFGPDPKGRGQVQLNLS